MQFRIKSLVQIIVLAFMFCLNVKQCNAQSLDAYYCKVDSLINISNRQYLDKDYHASLATIDNIIQRHLNNNNEGEDLGLIYYTKGYTLRAIKSFKDAETYLLKAISIFKRENISSQYLYNAYTQLAIVNRMLFDYEKAKDVYVESIDLFLENFNSRNNGLLENVVQNGTGLMVIGFDELSIAKLMTIEKAFMKYGLEKHLALSNLYSGMGIYYKNKGNYDLAFNNYKYAEHILKEQEALNTAKAFFLYNNLGVLSKKKSDYSEALYFYKKSLEIGKKIYPDKPHKIAITYSNLSQIYSRLGNTILAIEYVNKSLELTESYYGKSSVNYLKNYLFREEILYTVGHKSILITEEDLMDSLYNVVFDGFDFTYLKIKAVAYRADKNYSKSLHNINKAIEVFTEGQHSILHESFRDVVNLYAELGDILKCMYFDDRKDLNTLIESHKAYIKAIDHLEKSKQRLDLSDSAVSHIYSMRFVLKDAMFVFHKLYILTNSIEYLNKMIRISSLMKNIELEIKFNQVDAMRIANVPEEMINEIEIVQENINAVDDSIAGLKNSNESMFLKYFEKSKQYKSERETWFENVRLKYPTYYTFKHGYWNKDLQSILESKIGLDELLVDYVSFDSLIYVNTFSHFGSSSRLIKVDTFFKKLVQNIDLNRTNSSYQNHEEYLHNLYEYLIADELDSLELGINTLVVSSDGVIANIPIEMLFDKDYLINKFAVRYIHSIDFEYVNYGNANKSLAAFTPEYLNVNAELIDMPMALLVRDGEWQLPGAKREAQEIAELFKGDLFLGSNSNINQFKQFSSDYKILHLSMHTLVRDSLNNGFDFVFQSESENNKYELLDDNQISALDLNADLVVLSACNTGRGEYTKGGSIKSLANSFFYAGVPATVMSYWKVPDEQTSNIMLKFYEYLKVGKSKSKALQLAKLDYLNNISNPTLRNPFYWAGFVIIGNNDPIVMSQQSHSKIYFCFLAIIAIAILLLYKKTQ